MAGDPKKKQKKEAYENLKAIPGVVSGTGTGDMPWYGWFSPQMIGSRIGAETGKYLVGGTKEEAVLESELAGEEMKLGERSEAEKSELQNVLYGVAAPGAAAGATGYLPTTLTTTRRETIEGGKGIIGPNLAALAKRKKELIGPEKPEKQEAVDGERTPAEMAQKKEIDAKLAMEAGNEEEARRLQSEAADLRREGERFAREEKLEELRKQGTMGEEMAVARQEQWYHKDQAKKAAQDIKNIEATSEKQKKHFEGLGNRLNKLNEKINKYNIDPQRYVKEMPVWAQALFVVAAAFGGYAEGYSQGRIKNRAFDILNKAIDRDINAQKIRLEKLINQRDYTANERSKVENQIYKMLDMKKDAALRLSQAKLSQLSAAAKEPAAKLKYAKAALDLDEKTMQAKLKIAPRVTKIDAEQILKTEGPKGLPDPKPGDRKEWTEGMKTLRRAQTIVDKIEDLKTYGPLERRLPNTIQQRIRDMYLVPFAVSLRKAVETGVMTERDFERYKVILDRTFMSRKELLNRMKQIRNDILNARSSVLRSNREFVNTDPWRRELKEYAEKHIGSIGKTKPKPQSRGGVPSEVKKKGIKTSYAPLIKKYSGNIDPRVVAARVQVESGGNPTATAKAQKWKTGFGSEVGLLQLSPDARKRYGLTEEQAKNPETNIKYAMKQWNAWANNFFGKNKPKDQATRNVWAWLVTAVGPGAAARLRSLAGGYDLDKLRDVAEDEKLLSKNRKFWGSQSPGLVGKRIKKGINEVKKVLG